MKLKKGALELSVNSIVVLIIAVVVLGLILTFIYSTFGNVTTSIEERIGNEPEAAEPGGDEPITLSRETIITHISDQEVMKVGIYNPSTGSWTGTSIDISCPGATGIVLDKQFNGKNLVSGEFLTGTLLFKVGAVSPQKYLCSAKSTSNITCVGTAGNPHADCVVCTAGSPACKQQLSTGYSKDIVIEVQK